MSTDLAELFKVNYEADRITLSAKEVYKHLKVETSFKKWFKRIAEYGFDENIDYREVMDKKVQNPWRKFNTQFLSGGQNNGRNLRRRFRRY